MLTVSLTMAQQVVCIRLDCLVSGDMTRRNLAFDQAVSYVRNHIAGRRNCQTSQLGRTPPHGKKCLMQAFRETTMRFKCECCQTMTCLQWRQNSIALAIRITSRLTILKLLVLGLRLINLTMRVPS